MTTEEKAQALVDAVRSEYPFVADFHAVGIALSRAIEQHETFRQEVSDAVSQYADEFVPADLQRFIIPAPKPNPLVAMAEGMGYYGNDAEDLAEEIRAALEARGLEIREKNDD